MRLCTLYFIALIALQPAFAQPAVTSQLQTPPSSLKEAAATDSIVVAVPDVVDRWYPATSWRTAQESDTPHWNLRPYGTGASAGDVNGDGADDLLFGAVVADERTDALGDVTGKTFVFFGGNVTTVPDQVIYARLLPVGDVNGDGYADALADADPFVDGEELNTLYTGSSTGLQATGTSTGLNLTAQTLTHVDLDGDGYEDVVQAATGRIDIYWGHSDLEQFAVHSVDVGDRIWDLGAGDLSGYDLDNVVLLLEVNGSEGTEYVVAVVQIWAGREPRIIRAESVQQPGKPYVLEANGDTYNDVVVSRFGTGAVLLGTGPSGQENRLFDQVIDVSLPSLLFQPVGDVDGDGIDDVVIERTSQGTMHRELWFGPILENAGAASLSPDATLDFSGATLDAVDERFGDLNGDGRDDLVLSLSSEATFGRRIMYGASDRDLPATDVLYDRSDYVSDRVYTTSNLGDLNGDGTDDFAFLHSGGDARVAVYFGGDPLPQEPALEVRHRDGQFAWQAVGGDFNGDGQGDVAVSYDHDETGIEFYFGPLHDDMEADFAIPVSSLPLDNPGQADAGVTMLENAGDVNGDGSDDLMYAVPAYQEEEVYLTYGGASMTRGPDAVLSYAGSRFVGANLVRLGDVNGDGLDDIAAGAVYRTSGEGVGTVYVHFGREDGSAWGAPDLLLPAPRGTALFPLGVDGADVNGDGIRDIVAKPFTVEAAPGGTAAQPLSVEVFFGGGDIDALPDRRIPLPAAALGFDDREILEDNVGELTRVPDVDGDGDDELLVSSVNVGSGESHAMLILGGAEDHDVIQLAAPNAARGLGTNNNSLWDNTHSAVGDFDGDGIVDLLLTQERDDNDGWRSSRVYHYTPATTGSASEPVLADRSLRLLPAYPNPARHLVTVPYVLDQPAIVTVRVYDLLGHEVRVLHQGPRAAGANHASVNVEALASGVYIYRLEAGGRQSARVMTVVR